MDAPEFEPSTLSIGLMIDWHINPLSHHGSVQIKVFKFLKFSESLSKILKLSQFYREI